MSFLPRGGKYFKSYPNSEYMLFPSKEQRDWDKFEVPREDLSIDTPVMVTDSAYECWYFEYYAGNSTAWIDGSKSADNERRYSWAYIVPFDKFNPNDIEGSIKKYNYGTKQDKL